MESRPSNTQVLIVGAGPTGLVLALWLTNFGVRVRIVDKASAPGTTSRALAVHARTLELYDQMGLAEETVAAGKILHTAYFWVNGKRVSGVPFSDFGKGLSPFPFVLVFPQDEHERLLIAHLEAAGVKVERPSELVDFADDGKTVRARIKKADGSVESCEALYLCACDGARSIVRELLGTQFPGGTYRQVFYVADTDATGPSADGEMNLCMSARDFCLVFPLRRPGSVRLVGVVPENVGKDIAAISYDDVAAQVARDTLLAVTKVHWFSTYHVHHRVTLHFRKDRTFLLGDAAHIHSPAGGQGMNTGIGDAINLAWKLRDVLRGRASAQLLDSYESERIAFAERLVETTDRAFTLITNRSWAGRMARLVVMPWIAPRIMSLPGFRRFAFRTLSQLIIRYPDSALSAGQAGKVRGGDRLPWVKGGDNFASLKALDWQVHVYGAVNDALKTFCQTRGLALQIFAWSESAGKAGFARDALYLVRPDGYVAFADAAAAAQALERFLSARGLAIPPHG